MRTVFIVNPKAGKKKIAAELTAAIESVLKKTGSKADIYVTKRSGDGTAFVSEFCKKHGSARFIACGGDGTLSEVLNGVMGFEGCEVGVVPAGTGNDFCRNFGCRSLFSDIRMQIEGNSRKCDAIRYTSFSDGNLKTGYCVNMFNIGFDCKVADTTNNIKKHRFIGGSPAYFISILVSLIMKKCTRLKIELDGKCVHNGKLLLTSVANGSFCGGGIKSNPSAKVNDGRISINIIKNVSRFRFLSLLPSYMKGTFCDKKGIGRFIISQKCKKVTVEPECGTMRLCIDGEITDAGRTEFEIVHDAFDFVVPRLLPSDTNI